MKRDIAQELFKSFKTYTPKRKVVIEEERSDSSSPEPLKNILNELSNKEQWQQGLAEGNLFVEWASIVGSEVAEHCEPITILDGRLTIRARSSSWATQLRLLSPDLLKRINTSAPGVLIEELVVIGPQAPSWKRGLRTIRGARGPRDTYG
jgi:predicted nucleic acid-binding Zn ribbon protein